MPQMPQFICIAKIKVDGKIFEVTAEAVEEKDGYRIIFGRVVGKGAGDGIISIWQTRGCFALVGGQNNFYHLNYLGELDYDAPVNVRDKPGILAFLNQSRRG